MTSALWATKLGRTLAMKGDDGRSATELYFTSVCARLGNTPLSLTECLPVGGGLSLAPSLNTTLEQVT